MSIDNSNKKECEGCTINETCGIESSYIDPKTNETIKCPCIDCIVKVMCDTVCLRFGIYRIHRIRKQCKITYNSQFESEKQG